jgi:hypothetical protein
VRPSFPALARPGEVTAITCVCQSRWSGAGRAPALSPQVWAARSGCAPLTPFPPPCPLHGVHPAQVRVPAIDAGARGRGRAGRAVRRGRRERHLGPGRRLAAPTVRLEACVGGRSRARAFLGRCRMRAVAVCRAGGAAAPRGAGLSAPCRRRVTLAPIESGAAAVPPATAAAAPPPAGWPRRADPSRLPPSPQRRLGRDALRS